jgi:hypothetical protein
MTTVASDTFESYANTAAMTAVWQTTDDAGIMTVSLDGAHVSGGTKALKAVFSGPILGAQTAQVSRSFTGLTPGGAYTFRRRAYYIGGWSGVTLNTLVTEDFSVTADGSGTVADVGVSLAHGGDVTADATVWLDDIEIISEAPPGDTVYVAYDAGVLTIGGTAWGLTRGGFAYDPQRTVEQWPYDGNLYPVVALDAVAALQPILKGDVLTFSPTHALYAEPGGSQSGAVDISTTHVAPGTTLAEGDYLTNVAWTVPRFDGGYIRYRFPSALVTRYSAKSQDNDEHLVSLEIAARAATVGAVLYYVDHLAP